MSDDMKPINAYRAQGLLTAGSELEPGRPRDHAQRGKPERARPRPRSPATPHAQMLARPANLHARAYRRQPGEQPVPFGRSPYSKLSSRLLGLVKSWVVRKAGRMASADYRWIRARRAHLLPRRPLEIRPDRANPRRFRSVLRNSPCRGANRPAVLFFFPAASATPSALGNPLAANRRPTTVSSHRPRVAWPGDWDARPSAR